MKTGEAFADLLDAFVDGELSEEEAQTVRAHLDTCADCRAYVEDAFAIRAAFPDAEDVTIPADFTAKVMAAVQQSPAAPKSRKKQPWGRILLPLAACFALVLVLKVAGPAISHTAQDNTTVPDAAICVKNRSAEPNGRSSDPTENAIQNPSVSQAPIPQESPAPQETAPKKARPTQQEVLPALDLPLPASESPSKAGSAPASDAPTAYSAKTVSPYFVHITLTAEEAGTLLDGYEPVVENKTRHNYELTADQYQSLLEQLAKANIVPAEERPDTQTPGKLALITVKVE